MQSKCPKQPEGPYDEGVVEWFRVDALPFGIEPRPLPATQVHAPVDSERAERIAAALARARTAVANARAALSGAESDGSDQIRNAIDRILLDIAELQQERDVVDVAMTALKRRRQKTIS